MVLLRLVSSLAVWGAAMYGVLQIRHLTGRWDHILCGPWGCGPPLSALVAYHGFWLILLIGSAVVAVRTWSPRGLRYGGLALVLLGSAALIAMVAWCWSGGLPGTSTPYAVRRTLLLVAASVDVPAGQVLLAGMVCLGAAHRQQPCDGAARQDIPNDH